MSPNSVEAAHKRAYQQLLYWALIDIRNLESACGGWRRFSPFHWPRLVRKARYCGALAYAMHNVAMYAVKDFQGFDEKEFWRGIDRLRHRFPKTGMADYYRQRFENHLAEVAEDAAVSRTEAILTQGSENQG